MAVPRPRMQTQKMADSKQTRRKHTKRRYLIDQENPTIPKQSRRRWRETEVGANFHDAATVDTVADLDYEEEVQPGTSAETTTTTTTLYSNRLNTISSDTEITNVGSETADDDAISIPVRLI